MTDIDVEVVAGLPDRQRLIELQVPDGATVGDAIRESRIFRYFPELDMDETRLGVWGTVCESTRVLQSGDRVEVYRALKIEPREARRQLALLGKTMRDRTAGED